MFKKMSGHAPNAQVGRETHGKGKKWHRSQEKKDAVSCRALSFSTPGRDHWPKVTGDQPEKPSRPQTRGGREPHARHDPVKGVREQPTTRQLYQVVEVLRKKEDRGWPGGGEG